MTSKKELKSGTCERYKNYKKDERKGLAKCIALTIVFWSITLFGIGISYNFRNNFSGYVALSLLAIAGIFFFAGCISKNNAMYHFKEMEECDDYIDWLYAHKDYAYCEGDITESLENCHYVKLSEIDK